MKRSDITDTQVVAACMEWKASNPDGFVTDLLVRRTGAPHKVAEAAMRRALDNGFIDYGVSLRTAWATPEGKHMLAAEQSTRCPAP